MTIRVRAWLGVAVPPLIWFLFEQGLSTVLHADCHGRWIGVAWGGGSALICAAMVRFLWPLRRDAGEQGDLWLARLGPAIAGLFTLAILFQTLAVAMVPACVR